MEVEMFGGPFDGEHMDIDNPIIEITRQISQYQCGTDRPQVIGLWKRGNSAKVHYYRIREDRSGVDYIGEDYTSDIDRRKIDDND